MRGRVESFINEHFGIIAMDDGLKVWRVRDKSLPGWAFTSNLLHSARARTSGWHGRYANERSWVQFLRPLKLFHQIPGSWNCSVSGHLGCKVIEGSYRIVLGFVGQWQANWLNLIQANVGILLLIFDLHPNLRVPSWLMPLYLLQTHSGQRNYSLSNQH